MEYAPPGPIDSTFGETGRSSQERGFAGGLGALTFNTVAGSDVAGRVGVNVSPHVAVLGEFGRMSNALPSSDQQTILASASLLAPDATASPVILGGVRAMYGLGAVRVTGTPYGRVTPYGEAGYGFARLTNKLTVTAGGADVTSEVLTTTLTSALPQTDPLLTAGGGVTIAVRPHAGFDLGYRYSRIFAPQQGINSGKVYAAIRFGF